MSVTFWVDDAPDDPDSWVNVSNTNARVILDRLGLWEDYSWCGECPSDDFAARAMLANVGCDDTGTRAEIVRHPAGAVFVDCGVRPGYFAEVMGRLANLAGTGAVVHWA